MFKLIKEADRIDPNKINVGFYAGSIVFKKIKVSELNFDYEKLRGSATLELATLRILVTLEKIKLHKRLWLFTRSGIEYTQGTENNDD